MRTLLAIVLFSLLCQATIGAQKNIVLIVTDDQGLVAGCYGWPNPGFSLDTRGNHGYCRCLYGGKVKRFILYVAYHHEYYCSDRLGYSCISGISCSFTNRY